MRYISLLILLAFAMAAGAATPAAASSKVIYQKTVRASAGIDVMQGLVPGHKYRVNVTSKGKRSYRVIGSESYLYVASGSLHSGSKGVSHSGKTPSSFSLTQPRAGSLRQWILAIQISLARGEGLTVKITDLGT